MYSLDFIWNNVLEIIRQKLANSNDIEMVMSYFADTKLYELTEEKALITVRMKINKHIIASQTPVIKEAFGEFLKRDVAIEIESEDEVLNRKPEGPFDDHVIDDFTFSNFVVGPSNKEAYMAALSCASNPNKLSYNPLFIYGDSGLGKTHLLSAVGNYYKSHYPSKKVTYISSLSFVQEVVDAIKSNQIDQLKEQLKNIDLMLVDDIQALSGKTRTNEIFFDIYNELFNKRRQIIITSDRAPDKIKDVEERMVSRFKQGLTVTITSPEFETACEILKFKLKLHGFDLSEIDDEAISFVATNFSQDVRALDGALTRLLFYSINFTNSTRITLPLTMEAFKDQIRIDKKQSEITVNDIIYAVADYYGLTKQQLVSKTRTKNIANARHIAMYMSRKYLDVSFDRIGKEFGGRDHTTVLSAYEKIDDLVKENESYKQIISEIRKQLFG
ncbi:MAG: chromosomal replication initiator protein DnaA [Erysipelotrichaceae bacterium]|nr:chromosomal replication initiator protein DnaA [Erysipelotrichaceae bacterium]